MVAQYVRITLTDTSNPDGYIQAGRLMLGQEWSPTVNHNWGATIQTQDDSKLSRTRAGGLRSTPFNPYRVVDVSFGWLDDTDIAEPERIRWITGKRGSVLISVYPNEGGSMERLYTVFGRLTGSAGNTHQQTQTYNTAITVQEAI